MEGMSLLTRRGLGGLLPRNPSQRLSQTYLKACLSRVRLLTLAITNAASLATGLSASLSCAPCQNPSSSLRRV